MSSSLIKSQWLIACTHRISLFLILFDSYTMRNDGFLGGLILILIGVVGLLIYYPNYLQLTSTIGQLEGAITIHLQQIYNQTIEYVICMVLSILSGLSLILFGALTNPRMSQSMKQEASANLQSIQKYQGWKFILKSENSVIIYRSMMSSSIGLLLILVGFTGGLNQALEATINQSMLIIFLVGLALSVYGILNLYKI